MAANSPIFKGLPPGQLVETPDSGEMKIAEKVIYTQVFAGRYTDARTFALQHPRGSIWIIDIGAANNLFQVEDTSLKSARGRKGTVTINYLYLGLVPPDEFALPPMEINPAIEKHPFFAELTEDDLRQAKAAYNAATQEGQTTMDDAIDAGANSDLVNTLVAKWLRGEETFYLSGLKFQHTIFSFTVPSSTRGGFIQAPFGAFAGYISAPDVEWLRAADDVGWSNGLWKLTRTWLGGPAGHWDTDIYAS